jgi:type I restriction enzyme S subunit
MEVREPSANYVASAGRKSTELGELPGDWQVLRLGDVASVSSGGTPSRAVASYWTGNIPWVTTAQVDFCTIREAEQYISAEGLAASAAKLLKPGTLLMALYGQGKTRGKVAVLGIEATTNQACAAISVESGVSANYAFVFLGSRYEAIRKLSNTGNQENLSGALVKNLLIAVPSEREQSAITEAVGDADTLIESLEQLLAKKRQIKQGAMQQLLTGKRRLPGFASPWSERSLSELGMFLKGSGINKADAQSGELPCVRYGELYTQHADIVRSFVSRISRTVANTATPLRSGDILFAGSGETKAEIGKCAAFVDAHEAYAGGDIVILRPTGCDSRFLGYYLNTAEIIRQKASRGQGDAVVHIGTASLGSIRGRFPPQAEQTAIATLLSDLDTELEALEAQLAKARDLKQGMMQALLTGRIRLV